MVLKSAFRQTFENALFRQRDDYSCGPAGLTTIAGLCDAGHGHSYDFFRRLLSPRPNIGSHPNAVVEAARKYLPVTGAGDSIYKGGLALGYIVYEENKASVPDEPQIDHYVVFLAQKNNSLIYYDPYDDKVFMRDLNKMQWHSTFTWPGIDHRMERWAVTFKTPQWLTFDFCAAAAVPHARDRVLKPQMAVSRASL